MVEKKQYVETDFLYEEENHDTEEIVIGANYWSSKKGQILHQFLFSPFSFNCYNLCYMFANGVSMLKKTEEKNYR